MAIDPRILLMGQVPNITPLAMGLAENFQEKKQREQELARQAPLDALKLEQAQLQVDALKQQQNIAQGKSFLMRNGS